MVLTYEKSGVNISRADALVRWLKKIKTVPRTGTLLAGVGPFASVYRLPEGLKNPLIVTSSDGVGTKLEIARMAGDYSTVGVDLVAMNVNDIVCAFATPVLFLDYYAAAKIEEETYRQVMKGIIRGCRAARCALAGGETAEMPGFYSPGQIELSGFCVGITSENELKKIPPVERGDLLVGIPSSGFHSNGYSLLRALFFKKLKKNINDEFPGTGRTIGHVLLKPTKIYVSPALSLLKEKLVSAFVHVTGGGIPGNLTRILGKGLGAEVDTGSWRIPGIFKTVQELAELDTTEMFKTFNMGVGFIAVVKANKIKRAIKLLKAHRLRAYVIGQVLKGKEVKLI